MKFTDPNPYIPFRKRFWSYPTTLFLTIALSAQIVGLLIVGWWSANPLMLFFAGFISLGFVNLLFYAAWLKNIIRSIDLDIERGYARIVFYRYDKEETLNIPLKDLQLVVNQLNTRGGLKPSYKFCIYERQKRVFYQLCNDNYWTKEHCESIAAALKAR